MTIAQWWKSFRYRAHDRRGNAKCLLDRNPNESALAVEGISKAVQDEALTIFCKSFDIPVRQMYCLRCTDGLIAIYREMNGPRNFDQLQFERLGIEIEDIPGPELSILEIENIKTVADVIRVVGARRGITTSSS